MKKQLLLIFVISIAAMLLPASSQANMLKNPGFEEGIYVDDKSIPSYWQGERSEEGSWFAWKNSGGAHGGSKFIAVGGKPETEWGYYKQNVSGIMPGQTYVFSASVATEIWPDYPSKPIAYMKVDFKDGNGSVIRTDKLAVLSGENSTWDRKTLTTNPAPSGTTSADFICYGQGTGTVLFDDVSVEARPKAK